MKKIEKFKIKTYSSKIGKLILLTFNKKEKNFFKKGGQWIYHVSL